MTEDDVERLGHWSRSSTMTRRYDSASGVSERWARETLMKAFRVGWRPADDGCLPKPPPGFSGTRPIGQEFVPAPSPSGPLVQSQSGSDYGHRRSAKSCTRRPQSICQDSPGISSTDALDQGLPIPVYHQKRKRMHKTLNGSGISICKMWSCGSVGEPTKDAVYGKEAGGVQLCSSCWR